MKFRLACAAALFVFLGFLGACADNWLNLKKSELFFRGGVEVHRTTPVPIVVYHDSLGAETLDVLTRAIGKINAAAGCAVFSDPVRVPPLVGDGATPVEYPDGVRVECWNKSVAVDPLDPKREEVGLCETTYSSVTGVIAASTVTIPCSVQFLDVNVRVAMHEMMHSLGFAHDRQLGTIMYPNVLFSAEKFQDADLKILRGHCK